MPNIIIDGQFKSLMPELDKATYASLEENLLQNGCRDAVVLWKDILIDGHNRYEICTQHGIPYETVEKDFNSRDEALIWIITNQMARRNLTSAQLSYFRGLHYNAEKRLITNANGNNQYTEVVRHNGAQPETQSTAARLSTIYHVSPRTMNRDSKVALAISTIGESSPEAMRMILSGNVRLDKKELIDLSATPNQELSEIASKIEDGSYKKEKAKAREEKRLGSLVSPEGQGNLISPGSPSVRVAAGIESLHTAIIKLTNDLDSVLPNITDPGEKSALKDEISNHIVLLEQLRARLG